MVKPLHNIKNFVKEKVFTKVTKSHKSLDKSCNICFYNLATVGETLYREPKGKVAS